MSSLSPSDPSRITPLPEAGHAALSAFELAPDLVHLNHGSYGALPRRVRFEQERWRQLIEQDATGFFQDIYPGEVRQAAGIAALAFGGAPSDWVFCENATAAINSVLASLPLQPGDEIVTTSHAYGAVVRAMRLWAGRKDARLRIAELPAVLSGEAEVLEAVARALTPRTRLLVADHITSPTAAVLPVREIVGLAHAANIPVLVDGAHAPGQVELDVPAVGADWYTGNAHKWFFAPRGCGLLWTAPARQEITRPVVLSHGSERGYTEAFDWIGTRDVTPWLSLAAAAEAFEAFGGAALIHRNRALAAEAAEILVAASGGSPTAPSAMRAAMAAIALPTGVPDSESAARVRQSLRAQGVIVASGSLEGHTFLRVSAQLYNEPSDYLRCAEALALGPLKGMRRPA
jgi:isopenicillin-N epimerase